jgi:RNA-directed DNA polymerase
MQKSYECELATHIGPESCGAARKGGVEALTGERAGRVLSRPHICVKKRSNGRFTVLRQTIRQRLQTKLNEVKAELQRRMQEPIPEVGTWLQAVVRGHIRYYGVPLNPNALWIFRFQVGQLWHRALSRRSQNGHVLWDRMRRLITRWLPLPTVCHPYPLRRMGVVT